MKKNSTLMIIGIVIFIIAIKIIAIPMFIKDQVVDTSKEVIDKTLDADNVLYEYHWFKQQYEDVQAIDFKLEKSNKRLLEYKEDLGDRTNWTYEDKTEYSRLTSIRDGFEYQRQDMISKYNAKSKMLDKQLFKDKSLPYQLGIEE